MKRFFITAAMLLSATLWWGSESPVLSNDDGWGQNPENQSSPQAISCGALVPTPMEAGKPVPFLGYENVAGEVYQTATWLGNLRYAPRTYMGAIAMYFYQGSPTSEACRGTDEGQFRHTLTRTIAVMETEVTRNAWANLKFLQPTLPADPTDTSHSSGMNDPVQDVTWQEAILFANLYSQWAGLTRCYYTNSNKTTPIDATNYQGGSYYCDFDASGYRLPTEGEWEYFARAGTTAPFSTSEPSYGSGNCGSCSAGQLPSLEAAAVFCANGTGMTRPAGSKLANPWNLKDVHGNVYEWCWDLYGAYPSPGTQVVNYTGATSGTNRVIRSGSYGSWARFCRSAYRTTAAPTTRTNTTGFRLVCTVPYPTGSYFWTFGDGTTSNAQNPAKTYASAGTYTWNMTVTTRGQTCSKSGTITITSGCVAPSIVTQPASQIIASGQSATLQVVANGTGLTYQWYQGSTGDTRYPVGLDSDTCTTPPLVTTTNYWVQLSNSCGAVSSATATITVGGGGGLQITSIKSRTSQPGTKAQIRGSGFSADKTKNTVYFGRYKATVNRGRTSSLQVMIPRQLRKNSTVDVYVVVNGVQSNKVSFRVK